MGTLNRGEIKERVRERYGQMARQGTSCCGPATAAFEGIYTGTDLGNLPTGVTGASAGCGNPVALADLKPGETVLDLGSGGGIDCFLAAREVGPTGRVLGIDMTPDMVALARSNAQKIGTTNVEFYLGEMERMPLPDASVDVVISNCVICLSPDKDAVFQEAFRVLQPGGRLHASDMLLRGELSPDVAQDPEQWVACVAGAEPEDVYLDRIRRAGFTDVQLLEEQPHPNEALENAVSCRVMARKPSG